MSAKLDRRMSGGTRQPQFRSDPPVGGQPSRPIPDRKKTSGSAYLKAISHQIRAKSILILEHSAATAAEIAEEIGAPIRTVRHHLAILEAGGFITVSKSQQRRNVLVPTYVATTFGEVDDATYEALDAAEQRSLIDHYLKGMIHGLRRFISSGTTYQGRHPSAARVRLALDDDGWHRLIEICDAAAEEVIELRSEVAERLRSRGDAGFEAEFDVIAIEVPETNKT